jgi:hypothetical protein
MTASCLPYYQARVRTYDGEIVVFSKARGQRGRQRALARSTDARDTHDAQRLQHINIRATA